MDTPLISESGDAPPAGHRRTPRRSRSGAIAFGTNYQKAAALVDLVRFLHAPLFFIFFPFSSSSLSYASESTFSVNLRDSDDYGVEFVVVAFV